MTQELKDAVIYGLMVGNSFKESEAELCFSKIGNINGLKFAALNFFIAGFNPLQGKPNKVREALYHLEKEGVLP